MKSTKLVSLGLAALMGISALAGCGGKTFKIGDKINFTFGGNVMHLFGKESHQNLEY